MQRSLCVKVYAYASVHRGQRHQISWSWSYRQLWVAKYGCWMPNLGPLQKQYMLLPTESSLQSWVGKFLKYIFICLFWVVVAVGVMQVGVLVWKAEDKLRELALPFHCVGPRSLIRLSCFGGTPLTRFTFLVSIFIYLLLWFLERNNTKSRSYQPSEW